MEHFFSLEGPLISFLEKVGQLILIGLIWCVTSALIITIGPSTSALYYAAVKAVRRGRGYPVKEYFKMFKKVFLKGSIITLGLLLVTGLALFGRYYINLDNASFVPADANGKKVFLIIYDLIIIFSMIISIYIFPVLSRFEMKIKELVKLSFIISVRYIYYTAVLILIFIIGIFLTYRFLPLWAVIIWPGFMAYISSFFIERAMKKYIVVTNDNKDEWYIF